MAREKDDKNNIPNDSKKIEQEVSGEIKAAVDVILNESGTIENINNLSKESNESLLKTQQVLKSADRFYAKLPRLGLYIKIILFFTILIVFFAGFQIFIMLKLIGVLP